MIQFDDIQYTTQSYYFFLPYKLATELFTKLRQSNIDTNNIKFITSAALMDGNSDFIMNHRQSDTWKEFSQQYSVEQYKTEIKNAEDYFTETGNPEPYSISVIKTNIEPTYLKKKLLQFYGPTTDIDYQIECLMRKKQIEEEMQQELNNLDTK